MMRRFSGFILAAIMILGTTWAVAAAENEKGAEKITITAGKKGDILFPHRRHQAALGDCRICHATFPKEAGSINRMKAAKTLKRKQVMKTVCLACHRKMRKMNQPTGPTSCGKCHQKK